MKYEGKVYAKIGGRYIECTETIEDLENKIKVLESKFPSKMILEELLSVRNHQKNDNELKASTQFDNLIARLEADNN